MNKVFEINSEEELDKILNLNHLILIDFNAPWCGPCKKIKPQFHSLAEQFSNTIFLSINVDDNSELCDKYQVTALPTFIFIGNNQILHKVFGANMEELVKTLEKLNS